MAWWDSIKNALVPRTNRGSTPAGPITTTVPHLGAAKQATGGAGYTYGNLVELLSDAGNTSDGWVESIHVSSPDTANKDMMVCLSLEVAGGAPTAGKIEREVSFHTNTTVAADFHETIPITPSLFLPSGTGLRAACADDAGGKKISVWANISRNKT